MRPKADAARAIIEKFPHQSKNGLAKIIFQLHPLLFKNKEDARRVVQDLTGASRGPTNRTIPTHKDIYKGLPIGLKNDYSKFHLDAGKWGILSDIHIPYHDQNAVEIALEHFYKKGIKNILLNGDILDCYQASDHMKEPTMPQLKEEFDMLKPWLGWLQKKFKVVYKLGNHEERLERVLLHKAPMLWGWEVLSWAALIQSPSIPVVENKRIVKAGKLSIVHGHEFGRQQVFNPVNPARGYFLRAKASVLGGDKHQTSEHTESDINGKIIGAWSTGCLCELHPKYLPINRWNLGFATIEHDDNDFEVSNLKIVNGKVR